MTTRSLCNGGGTLVSVRAIEAEDREALARGFMTLSAASRRFRFFTIKAFLRPSELDYLINVDQFDHIALVASILENGEWLRIGVGRSVRLKTRADMAEVSLVILDRYQGIGVGKFLLEQLAEQGAKVGIRFFQAIYLSENLVIENMVRRYGAIPGTWESGVQMGVLSLERILSG